jgi:hypothetical protein
MVVDGLVACLFHSRSSSPALLPASQKARSSFPSTIKLLASIATAPSLFAQQRVYSQSGSMYKSCCWRMWASRPLSSSPCICKRGRGGLRFFQFCDEVKTQRSDLLVSRVVTCDDAMNLYLLFANVAKYIPWLALSRRILTTG